MTLPLVTPGILAGAALVFLTVMKELPATLILSPLGFRTLPMSVWSSISEAYFAQAAAPVVVDFAFVASFSFLMPATVNLSDFVTNCVVLGVDWHIGRMALSATIRLNSKRRANEWRTPNQIL